MAWAAGRVKLAEMLLAWAIIYFGNVIGAVGTALLVYLSGQALNDGGAVASVAMKLANDKVAPAFFLGILCNVLVCLPSGSPSAPLHHRQGACRPVSSVGFRRRRLRAFGRQYVSYSARAVPQELRPGNALETDGPQATGFAGLTWLAFFEALFRLRLETLSAATSSSAGSTGSFICGPAPEGYGMCCGARGASPSHRQVGETDERRVVRFDDAAEDPAHPLAHHAFALEMLAKFIDIGNGGPPLRDAAAEIDPAPRP
jgi:hypothetical protein